MIYLMTVHLFSEEDLHLNSAVFNWKGQIEPIFDTSEEIAQHARSQGELELASKMQGVHKEIQRIKRRLDEFNDYSELDLMSQYVKDAFTVQRQLQGVNDTIEWIHRVRLRAY